MPVQFDIQVDPNFKSYELGFLAGSKPATYKRLMSMASVNAARTFSQPIKQEAPRGKTGNLVYGVKARAGRYQKPSAVVGSLFSGRGSSKNPWYRWHVVKGTGGTRTTKNGTFSVRPVRANQFVNRAVENTANQQKAIDAFYKTIEAFYNNSVFHGRILQFRRGSQLRGMGTTARSFFGAIGKAAGL